jgi:hypothetical protein
MKHKEEFITEEKVINTPAGGVLIGKDKEGQTIIPNDGSLGGFLIGRTHKDGGIKAINKGTGQPLEMQVNEVVITAPAVADTKKREFEGKMMTNREILSKINSDGGGVSFADGGDIPAKIHTTDCEYKFGGKVVKDTDIAHSLGMNSTLKKGKQQFSSGDTTYDVDAIYNAIKKGKLLLKTKEVETFPMKYPVYDKNYAENHKIDFRKPNGITVRTESGEEILIDGNHRMNNAYSKGRKTMKTYYVEDPKQIAKFTKKNKFELAGENKMGGHLSSGKSLKQIAEMHNVTLTHINEELAKGLEVEKEHFSDFKERTRVAKDHLVENPNYYTILEKAGLKMGGHIQSQELVEKSKKGDTPARDLNNYNDVLDLEADGVVGMESGLAFANGGEFGNEPREGDLITNFGKYGVSIFDVDDNYVYWLDKYASKQYCKKSDLLLNNLDDDGDDDGYYEDERNNWVCNKAYDNGGLTPYDANLDGDSISIIEEEFANGGGVELPKVAYVRVTNSGSSLSNLLNNNYNSYIEFAESVEYAYKQLGKKVRSYVELTAFDENDKKLVSATSYISDQKNTIKNFNPLTGNYKNLEKSLSNSRPINFQKFNWEDWLTSKVNSGVLTPKNSNSNQNEFPEYYEYISENSNTFTKGKIYKIIKPENIEALSNFIDNSGIGNGFAGDNYLKFKPSTKEAFLLQYEFTSSKSNTENSVDVVRLEYEIKGRDFSPSFRTGENLLSTFIEIQDLIKITSIDTVSVNIIAEVTDKTGRITAKKERINIGENAFKPSNFSYEQTKKLIEEEWFDNQLNFDKFFKLEPKKSTKEKVMFLNASSENTEEYVNNVTELRYFIERQFALNDAKSGRVYLYLNGDESQGSWRITFGDNQTCTTCYDMLTNSSKRLKEILLNYAGADEFDWSDFFEEEQTNTPISVVPKTVEDSVYSLDLAIKKLEKASSTVVTEYNKEIYDKSLKFLYETKATYELALKFTPESAFMYERLDILKKLANIEKNIKNIEDMKKGGTFYMLAKILEKLELGENWKQSESVEDVITNNIPKSEIDIIIRSQKFKNWFGNWEKALINDEYDNVSKALTDGIPSVYHHGARRIKYTYREVSNGVLYLAEDISYALWFSQNATAQSEEGNYLTECFVNIKNPIDLTAFYVNEVDLADIVRFIDAIYPMAKIYDFIPAQVALLIKTNQPTNIKMRSWQLIRSYAKFVNYIKENTPYDGFLYYENNPSDKIINPVTGQLEDNVTKAVAIFKSHQVKVVDAVLFDGGLDDWRFDNGGKIKN